MNAKEKELTGYPSIDKPWLKYYSEEAINAELPDCSLYEYLYENNKDYKDEYALNYFGRKITYGELFENIDVVAKAFLVQGIKAGDVCTIVTLSCVTSVLCFYALNKIGAVSNFINVLSSEEELKKYFDDAESETVVTLDLFGERVIRAASKDKVKRVIVYSLSEWMPIGTRLAFEVKMRKMNMDFMQDNRIVEWRRFVDSARRVTQDISFQKNPRELCLLAHTGGTTGFPKSVLITDYGMNSVVCQYGLCMELKRKKTFMNILPPFVVYGLEACLHVPLCLGLCTTIIPKFDASKWKNYLTKYKPNYILGIPSYFASILEDKKLTDIDLSFVDIWGVGGDGMSEVLEKNINEFLIAHNSQGRLMKGYGMTEMCATTVVEHINCFKIGSVGVAFSKNNIQIYDNEKKLELKYGEIGEICLLSPSLMLGYKNNEQEMQNLIKQHSDGNYWVHTGDLGYIDEEGFLFVSGRIKRFIIVIQKGTLYKIFPTVIEKIIREIDSIGDVCVVGSHHDNDRVPKAYITLKKECQHQEIEEKIKALCAEKLPDYMIPYYYEFLDALPLTAAGKVDYKALEE